jgi:hypothetical protein
MNRRTNLNYASTVDKESIVYEYFRFIKQKDVNALLNLFVYDAVISSTLVFRTYLDMGIM